MYKQENTFFHTFSLYTEPRSKKGRLDFLEIWQTLPKQRLFSVDIKTRNSSFTIFPIDLVELDSTNGPISIVVGITSIDFIEISTDLVDGSKDLPFISGIRLYSHF